MHLIYKLNAIQPFFAASQIRYEQSCSKAEYLWLRAAWLCCGLAIPWRLWFFAGYGLGDDYQFVWAFIHLLEHGWLDFNNYYHSRLLMLLPQYLSFLGFGISDVSFVLPTFLFSIASHAILILIANRLFSARITFFISLITLSSPYETLCATSYVYDTMLTFYSLCALWCGLKVNLNSRLPWTILTAFFCFCGIMVKVAGLLVIPLFLVITFWNRQQLKIWWPFWITFVACFFLIGLFFYGFTGNPLHWFFHNSAPPFEISAVLFEVLSIYPRYLFGTDDYQHMLFGFWGLFALPVWLLLPIFWFKGHRSLRENVFMILLLYLLLFEFVPHKIDFSGYYSVPRIFRYLSQISPIVYLSMGYYFILFERFQLRWIHRSIANLTFTSALLFAFWHTAEVTYPSRDPNHDGQLLTQFFDQVSPPAGTVIQGDFRSCERIKAILYPRSSDWIFHCPAIHSEKEKKFFFDHLTTGYLITGGAALAWYENPLWQFLWPHLLFAPPEDWKLMFQHTTELNSWRKEVLKIWEIKMPLNRWNIQTKHSTMLYEYVPRQLPNKFVRHPESSLLIYPPALRIDHDYVKAKSMTLSLSGRSSWKVGLIQRETVIWQSELVSPLEIRGAWQIYFLAIPAEVSYSGFDRTIILNEDGLEPAYLGAMEFKD